jgi:hypothetical protein
MAKVPNLETLPLHYYERMAVKSLLSQTPVFLTVLALLSLLHKHTLTPNSQSHDPSSNSTAGHTNSPQDLQ